MRLGIARIPISTTASSLFRPRWVTSRIFSEVFFEPRAGCAATMLSAPFDLQGHRGARGLKPENTLPSFELALDLGVTSIETDVHLSRDHIPVLLHDALLSDRICRLLPERSAPDPAARLLVSTLTLAELRSYRAD